MASSDRTVIITGAGHGIGRACARRFAAAGDNVVLVDISEEAGQAALDEVASSGGAGLFVHGDVSERLDIHNILAQTLDAFGGVNVLVNNAAVMSKSDFLDIAEDDFDRVLKVNLKGPFLTSQAVAKQMAAQIDQDPDHAVRLEEETLDYAIINISSVQALVAVPDQMPYAVSKGGLNQLTKGMAVALAPLGIRVNAVGPGAVNTDMEKGYLKDDEARARVLSRTPLGRIGAPEEVANAAYFLASPAASYITGQCLYVDGGRLALNYTTPTSS